MLKPRVDSHGSCTSATRGNIWTLEWLAAWHNFCRKDSVVTRIVPPLSYMDAWWRARTRALLAPVLDSRFGGKKTRALDSLVNPTARARTLQSYSHYSRCYSHYSRCYSLGGESNSPEPSRDSHSACSYTSELLALLALLASLHATLALLALLALRALLLALLALRALLLALLALLA